MGVPQVTNASQQSFVGSAAVAIPTSFHHPGPAYSNSTHRSGWTNNNPAASGRTNDQVPKIPASNVPHGLSPSHVAYWRHRVKDGGFAVYQSSRADVVKDALRRPYDVVYATNLTEAVDRAVETFINMHKMQPCESITVLHKYPLTTLLFSVHQRRTGGSPQSIEQQSCQIERYRQDEDHSNLLRA